ncbi:hypothetical protein [Larkinella sp.]|uniref:hypothetical protein n=1 Tax=Larkinella sp. TaxID=2034517 RepID=UPI003BAB5729
MAGALPGCKLPLSLTRLKELQNDSSLRDSFSVEADVVPKKWIIPTGFPLATNPVGMNRIVAIGFNPITKAINPVGMIHFVLPRFNPPTNAINPVGMNHFVASGFKPLTIAINPVGMIHFVASGSTR